MNTPRSGPEPTEPPTDTSEHTTTAAAPIVAGGAGFLAACCTVHLLLTAGIIGSLSGLAFGGITLAAGLATAAIALSVIAALRHRNRRRSRPHRLSRRDGC